MKKNKKLYQSDYCYACVAVSSTGQEHICGFSRTFAGLADIRENYLGACHAENIKSMSFARPERWSRKDIVEFFTGLKEKNVRWAYLLYGFVTGKDKIFLKTPDDVDSFLCLKDLYTNEE